MTQGVIQETGRITRMDASKEAEQDGFTGKLKQAEFSCSLQCNRDIGKLASYRDNYFVKTQAVSLLRILA